MNILHILNLEISLKILYNFLAILFCFGLGYFFGAIPTSIWIGKVFFHQDPRDFGSHNPGGTNAGRLWGKKVGFLVICLDMFKTIVPMWICWAIFTFIKIDGQSLCPSIWNCNELGLNFDCIVPWPVYWISTIGCMIGHCWPVFAQFKGGKGVSCFMGVIVTSSWMFGFIPGLMYFMFLKITKYVSLTGILTGAVTTVLAWVWAILCCTHCIPQDLLWLPTYGPNVIANFVFAICITVMTGIMIVRHHENIDRLIKGNERRVTWIK